ncbi:MAG: ATP-binding cassette domain-containing protein [Methanophagales archaeon]|nr:ATP-binding cassette domain-containing protein [Methanophagales archaeon]MCW3141038.1 ATP-binding cassette domain-containing protein [Methanophagales archaeon]
MPLEIKDVDTYYGSVKILDSINFNASHGELLGIIGPNGSGKTTLLRTISRILKPKVGAILLEGRDVLEMGYREFSRIFAAVPQDTTINFDFSALDIVLMGRNPHLGRLELESEKDIEIARRSMRLTNCWEFAERPITELSGGERQLVIIARALTQEPKVLLLDEPTSHLDINYQIEIMELLKRLTSEEKLIVIAVIHDLNLAARYCDRLVLLHDGKIVSLGTQAEVLTAENIKNTFGADVIVKKHALTNHCYVSPVPSPLKRQNKTEAGLTVHLICGGGEGASLMHELAKKGYKVSVGVVNMLDTDYEVAKLLNIPVVTEAPYSPISEEAFQAHLAVVDRANVVVLCNIPFGFGNLRNLEVAERALERNKPLLVFEATRIEKRDFTNGEATKRFIILKGKGAIRVKNQEEVFKAIGQL